MQPRSINVIVSSRRHIRRRDATDVLSPLGPCTFYYGRRTVGTVFFFIPDPDEFSASGRSHLTRALLSCIARHRYIVFFLNFFTPFIFRPSPVLVETRFLLPRHGIISRNYPQICLNRRFLDHEKTVSRATRADRFDPYCLYFNVNFISMYLYTKIYTYIYFLKK